MGNDIFRKSPYAVRMIPASSIPLSLRSNRALPSSTLMSNVSPGNSTACLIRCKTSIDSVARFRVGVCARGRHLQASLDGASGGIRGKGQLNPDSAMLHPGYGIKHLGRV